MSYEWEQAVPALLSALGIETYVDAGYRPRDLQQSLRGSGIVSKRADIIGHILPTPEGMVGALLEMKDGSWLPVLGGQDGMVVLNETGQGGGTLDEKTIQEAASLLILQERIASLEGVMPFLRRYKARFFDLLLAAMIINTFALALPLFSSFVYDKILGNGVTATLWALVIGLLLITGVEFCVRILRIAAAERFAVASEVDIDHSTFRNLMDVNVNKMPTLGGLLEKYKQILSYRDFLSSSYLLALADLPFLLLFLAAVAIAAGPLVFVGLTAGTLMLLSSIFFVAPVLDYEREAKVASEKRYGLLTDVLTAREAVIGGALRNELAQRWRQASVGAVLASSRARFWRGFSGTILNSISYMSFIGILVGGVYMVEARELTSGGLLAASMLTSRMMGMFSSVSTLVTRYREFRTALRELNQIMPASVHRRVLPVSGRLRGAIRVDRVTCRLRSGDSPVLKDVSIAINPGEIVGIAGAPGAGKTTLLRIITGGVVADEGRVFIDDIPLDHLALEDISANIGFKPQEFGLLDGTIEENVRAGRGPMSAEVRQDVLASSGLFRAFQENGLNWGTDVGPRGSSLSGGQRQLVSLARAMVGYPAVLILDEPTNGLDTPLENHLAQSLARMRGKQTMLISTHSRTMLSICDRIIVVGQSRILADGPREKVMVN